MYFLPFQKTACPRRFRSRLATQYKRVPLLEQGGFGTNRLRRQEAMKTAGTENPNRTATLRRNRAHGVARQNRSCSVEWAPKQEKFQPKEMCFLTSTCSENNSFYAAFC